ncbi:MAG TPA: hypothetical protein GXX75_06855 [Clostridiales bacterium]|nr:hypothetical protein [Clostridiales bacterium]
MEFLKAILGDKYPEFEAAITAYNALPENKDKQVKLANLGSGEYVGKAKYDSIEQDRNNYKSLLETAQTTLKKFEGVNVEDLQGEIEKLKDDLDNKDTEYKEKLSQMEYDGAINKYFESFKFTSDLAKRAAMDEFRKKELKLENGTFLGGDDYMKQLKEANPTAFEAEDDGEKPPTLVKPTKPRKPGEKMTLAEAMKYKNDHPDVDISTLI